MWISYQFCFKKLWNIESSAEEYGGEQVGDHLPGDAGAEVALPVLVRPAHTAVSLIGNHDGEEDGAAEDDVVEGEEDLRKDDGVHLIIMGKRPFEHCNTINYVGFYKEILQ